jgi:hypothetical protein
LVNSDLFMLKFSGFVLLLLMAAFAGGAVYLAFWDIPPPSAEIVRQLPDDQFPRCGDLTCRTLGRQPARAHAGPLTFC